MSEFHDRLQAALGGAYRVVQELGGAGMSRVFVAEEIALSRRVVVKVLPPRRYLALRQDAEPVLVPPRDSVAADVARLEGRW